NPGSRSGLLAIDGPPQYVDQSDKYVYHTTPRIAVTDFNLDGYADIAAYTATPLAKVFTSTGTGTLFTGSYYSFPESGPLTGSPIFQHAADVNNDGLTDLLFLSSGYPGIAIAYYEYVATPPGYTVQTTGNPATTSPTGPPDF